MATMKHRKLKCCDEFWSAAIPRLRDRFQSADVSAQSKMERHRKLKDQRA
jgi:hypothetical protein